MTDNRPVAFTHDEAARLTEFLRKFQASSEANDLLHMVALRKVQATVAELGV